MVISELIRALQQFDEDAEVILLWHSYQRRVKGVELIRPGLVQIIDEPKLAAEEDPATEGDED